MGRRISKTTAGVTTRFYRDGDALLGELRFERKDGTDAYEEPVCTRWREWIYYPGSFEPLAMVEQASLDKDKAQPERIYYYANDPNGCPTRLLDETGKVVWAALYDAWGKVKKLPANEVDQPLRLQGQYFDAETGLYYNRFRYYCPEIGAFVSQDPLGLTAGENTYQLAENVFKWVDPLGLCKKAKEPVKSKTTAIQKFYPDNDGYLGPKTRKYLMPGDKIDRYGGSDYSRFFSPQGTPEMARSLPPASSGQPLRTFEVLKPFEVEEGPIAPAFGKLGFGTQYTTPVRLKTLLKRGIIREI